MTVHTECLLECGIRIDGFQVVYNVAKSAAFVSGERSEKDRQVWPLRGPGTQRENLQKERELNFLNLSDQICSGQENASKAFEVEMLFVINQRR